MLVNSDYQSINKSFNGIAFKTFQKKNQTFCLMKNFATSASLFYIIFSSLSFSFILVQY